MKKLLSQLNALPSPRAAVDQQRTLKQLASDLQDGCEELVRLKVEAESIHSRTLNQVRLQGQRLTAIKAQVGHGNFSGWVEQNLTAWSRKRLGISISYRTARNWMRAAAWSEENMQLFSQLKSVAHLYVLAGILPEPDQPELETEPVFSLAMALRYARPLKRLTIEAVLTLPPDQREQLKAALKPGYDAYEALSHPTPGKESL